MNSEPPAPRAPTTVSLADEDAVKRIVTGGGPGLMQAANAGAQEAQAGERVHSIGMRVELPFEQEVNPFVEPAFEHRTFFTRLHQCGATYYQPSGNQYVEVKVE